MEQKNKRKFKRLATNLITRMRRASYRDTTVLNIKAIEQEARIQNISLGGVFIETPMPFEVGAHIVMDFAIPGYPDEIRALGVVKWSNSGSMGKEQPIGMGIEFLELTAHSKGEISKYVDTTISDEYKKQLLKSTLHQNLLRYYCKKAGEIIEKEALATFLACKPEELDKIIVDFEKLNLIKVVKNQVKFLPTEDKILSETIKEWLKTQK
jgi:uncharacterized protein (TIGR02266 family)